MFEDFVSISDEELGRPVLGVNGGGGVGLKVARVTNAASLGLLRQRATESWLFAGPAYQVRDNGKRL